MGVISLLSLLATVLIISRVGAGDEATLLAFKALVSSGDSRALASWNSSVQFCGWEGVTCSHPKSTRVVALVLYSRGLTGALSPALGNLTFLRTLNLSSNGLHGEIPTSLGHLRNLLMLDLSFNWLRGEIPASLGNLRRLQTLKLSYNSFTGTIPVNLSSCINMTYMALHSNKLGGHIPDKLGETLAALTVLSLRNNSFTGPIPASLSNMSYLQYLDLSNNQLFGSIPPGLTRIQSMQQFDISINNLSGMLPSSLYNLSMLETFIVGRNMLHGTVPADIGNKFPRMRTLNLAVNQFSGTIPSSITNLSDLRLVLLYENQFSGYVPPTLGRLGALKSLNIYQNKLEANDSEGWEFITSLANCSQLQYLVLSKNSFEGQLPVSIVNLSTTLQKLYLDDNRISGSIPADIGNLVGLDMVVIVNTSMSGVIPESIGKLQNLTDLALYSSGLTGLIPPSVGNLTKLSWFLAYYNNLEGAIPESLGNLKELSVLDLSTNYRLNGSIPKDIFKLPSVLWQLDLSYNSLSGPLPIEVGTMTNLNELILSGNQLSGQIPSSIGNCRVLQKLLLDKNSFEGSIPQSLENLKGLNILNLTTNNLSGRIPDAIGSIQALQQLFLAHNSLSGSIPAVLQNLSSLFKLDVSFNHLQGEVPYRGYFRNLTYMAVVGNRNLCGGTPELQLTPCSTNPLCKKKMSKSLKISLVTTGATLLSLSVILLVRMLHNKLKQRQKGIVQPLIAEDQYERIPYHALLRGTNGFSEANLLGKGRYGAVYRCILESGERTLAVKVFNLWQSGSSKSFEAECEAMRRIRHRCLIKIITCCSSVDHQGQEFKALVFEIMPNGSLDGWLHPEYQNLSTSNTLSLAQRLDIAVDVVDAIQYLHNHCQPLIIHCDLKPSNILLAEDMSARVGDFGISKILLENTNKRIQNSYSSTAIRGTIGYVAPEYGEGCAVSPLGDIYSLGILLLEIFTGRSPTDEMFRDALDLPKFVRDALPDRALEIADTIIWLHGQTEDNIATSRIQECLVSVFMLGISCSKQQPQERPLIRDAAVEMHAIRDVYLEFVG
ncbi:hypothetical protein BRADI_2g00540v3 [Brachypodium distachyon]|uniref:Receptor kinase-like protein Xa21 n=2 Tax=Brachypodium distachyon TaxID=15368 RepID=I1HB49_BRADI|nr:hypothetical protein BRADI_2g00540v3 [Brachypodium distachyon]